MAETRRVRDINLREIYSLQIQLALSENGASIRVISVCPDFLEFSAMAIRARLYQFDLRAMAGCCGQTTVARQQGYVEDLG